MLNQVNYPLSKIQQYFKYTIFTVNGYGNQGRAIALNLKDNGLNVLIGSRHGNSYNQALKDGFIPNINLVSIEEATSKGDIIMNLLSNLGQKQTWHNIIPYLTKDKTLYFSNGFNIIYKDQTKIIPPSNIDVIMVSPKCSSKTLRSSFINKNIINSNIAVYQDYSGFAEQNAKYVGYAIGSKNLYKTTFENEVYNYLVKERYILMSAFHSLFLTQYDILQKHEYPQIAFNKSIEKTKHNLIQLIINNQNMIDERDENDLYQQFERILKPIINELYDDLYNEIKNNKIYKQNLNIDYLQKLNEDLEQIIKFKNQ